MSTHRYLLLLLLIPGLLGARCGPGHRLEPKPTRQISETLSLPQNARRIEIQFHEGLLTLEPGAEIRCRVQVGLQANDEESLTLLAASIATRVESLPGNVTRLTVPLPTGQPMDAVHTTWRMAVPTGTDIVVKTRKGSVECRGLNGNLTVEGGSGRINARRASGHADLSTTSGELRLRGNYSSARATSLRGRVAVELPPHQDNDRLELQVANDSGNTYLDLQEKQRFELFFKGEEQQLQLDPTVRVNWTQGRPNRELLEGEIGDLQAPVSSGEIRLSTEQSVQVRTRPQATAAGRDR
ncbi:MAG: hypothetical protein VYE77_05265 [Planctomycetota bacterium]|nr:hypothetical protein [Planctomycetota bacterium]